MSNKTHKTTDKHFWEMDFLGWFIVFAVSTSVIAIERFTPVYLNNSYVRLIFHIVSASLLSLWIGWIFFGFKAVRRRKLIFIIVAGLCILKAYLTWGGDWKTQTILYTKKDNDSKTIEFQMRGDRFAFGYKKRIVERQKLLPFIDYINDVDTSKVNVAEWKRVDKKVNQLGLKDFNDVPSD